MTAKQALWGLLLLATVAFLCGPVVRGEETVIAAGRAGDFVGREVAIERTVLQVSGSHRSESTYLNVGAPYTNQTFTAVIFRSNRSLSKAREWEGKRVPDQGKGAALQGQARDCPGPAGAVTLADH